MSVVYLGILKKTKGVGRRRGRKINDLRDRAPRRVPKSFQTRAKLSDSPPEE
jgi:hypothetical protein